MPGSETPIATFVTSHAIRAGRETAFDGWADELGRLARAARGYRASLRLGQTAGFQHLLFRFDDQQALEAWRTAPALHAHLAAAQAFSTALEQTASGDGAAFALPSDASASKWKRFVVTWLTVFPVLLVVNAAVRAVLGGAPLPLQLLPSSLMLTATLQWIILPRLQYHARFWLLEGGSGRLRQ